MAKRELKSRTNPKGLEEGDEYEGHDMEGHLRVYTVIGYYEDGTPKSWGYNAPHSDKCRCYTSEDW